MEIKIKEILNGIRSDSVQSKVNRKIIKIINNNHPFAALPLGGLGW
jgi:hypothetical protein